MTSRTAHKILVTGATGFIGRALVPALVAHGHVVRACSRRAEPGDGPRGVEVVRCDLTDPSTIGPAVDGVDVAYYLVHSLGRAGGYAEIDRRAARAFREAADRAGLRRIVYLGGVAPSGEASEHLRSRLEVGELLRAGSVPTCELRAAMIIGVGSASWQIVRDLSLRLPAMILPAWLQSRLRPIALDDVVRALVDALDIPLPASEWFDIPGPDTLTAREILERVAALDGRRVPAVAIPLLSPRISALWLRLVTRANYAVARELVLGLSGDLLPIDERYWELTGHPPRWSFDDAARRALEEERRGARPESRLGALEESLVRRFGRRLSRAGSA